MTLVDADLIPDHIEHRVTLPDGRILAAAEWGDPNGMPFLTIHGTPGGRIRWWKDPTSTARYGLRRITFDRPGYGESSRHPGGASLTRSRTSSTTRRRSGSTGSRRRRLGRRPAALALAALLPDRVVRCVANVSVAPFDAEGLDWMAGHDRRQRHRVRRGHRGRGGCPRRRRAPAGEGAAAFAEGNVNWMGDDYALSEADQAQMQKHFARVRAHIANGLAPGGDGWIDDLLVFVRPWGFDVASIRVPVLVSLRSDRTCSSRPRTATGLRRTSRARPCGRRRVRATWATTPQIEREYAWLTGRTADPRSVASIRAGSRDTPAGY